MSERSTLDQYIETLQVLAHEGDVDRTDEERARDAAHRAKLIDAYAHELAETIRKQTARGNLIRPEHEEAWEAGLDCAASLIDTLDEDGEPKRGGKVSAGPVRPDEEPT